MDWKEIYNENDTFEQAMHDTLVMIGTTICDLQKGKFTPPQALTLVEDMINTFAIYALAHIEEDDKYNRSKNEEV